MNCRRRMSAATPSPNAHKRKEPKGKNAKPVKEYSDKHGMERHADFRGKPHWDGAGQKLAWGK